jgi:hypothetical protein
MIVESIVIVLTILILANVALGFYNRLYPPCMDAKEYFSNAKKLPDGVSLSLGSIPSGVEMHYVGAQRVYTGIPGVIGLTSYNDGLYKRPVSEELEDDLDDLECIGDTCTAKPSKINSTTYDALSAMFPTSSQKTGDVKKVITEVAGHKAVFDATMEGVKAPVHIKSGGVIRNPSQYTYDTERDGYSER